MKDDRITVRLPSELRRRLKFAAQRGGTSESALIRRAIERYVEEDKSVNAYERAKQAGLIGAVRGASNDLSSNPAHLYGFGGLRPSQ